MSCRGGDQLLLHKSSNTYAREVACTACVQTMHLQPANSNLTMSSKEVVSAQISHIGLSILIVALRKACNFMFLSLLLSFAWDFKKSSEVTKWKRKKHEVDSRCTGKSFSNRLRRFFAITPTKPDNLRFIGCFTGGVPSVWHTVNFYLQRSSFVYRFFFCVRGRESASHTSRR